MKEIYNLNDSWNFNISKEELIINNTFKNSMTNHEEYYEVPDFFLVNTTRKIKATHRISWGEYEKA